MKNVDYKRSNSERIYVFVPDFPITNKVVFSSFDGKNFGDDPKAIFDEMIKQGIETEYIWLLDDIKFDVPENVKLVKAFSILAIYHWQPQRCGSIIVENMLGQ